MQLLRRELAVNDARLCAELQESSEIDARVRLARSATTSLGKGDKNANQILLEAAREPPNLRTGTK